MLSNENKSLFNEVTTEESATVSGGLDEYRPIVGFDWLNMFIVLGAATLGESPGGANINAFERETAWTSAFVTRR